MRRAAAAVALLLGLIPVAACGPDDPDPAAVKAARAAKDAADAAAAAKPAPDAADGSGAPGDQTSADGAAPRPDGSITVAFAGDVHFEGRTEGRLSVQPPETALGPIGRSLAAADLSVLNLETAITERGAPEPKTYTFRTSPKALTALKDSGVDVVSLANNHAVDFGADGLADTLAAKASSPLPIVGFGRNSQEAYAPYVTTVRGVKVAVVAASQVEDLTNQKWRAGVNKPGIASALDQAAIVKAVEEAKKQAPVVLVYLHWGEEGKACPTGAQTAIAKRLATAGATAVVGTHAHTMVGSGMLGSTYIGYGFGNFLWYGTSNYANSNETGVTTLTVGPGGKVLGEAFAPATIDDKGVPVPQTGAAATAALKRRDGLRGCTGLAPAPGAAVGPASPSASPSVSPSAPARTTGPAGSAPAAPAARSAAPPTAAPTASR
ncbi:CapA family protein [Kitasatospora purpeofusca]|uniref:CapA family protein n=1 Tax=Kitasatospora purpeofusca TaxID=67352 RepID=UPI002A5A66ED|nr:CapA family protein [Kitasatospora purpeofusca]MDY0811904.1 CapA family protein [Kitasatospora purpeofusca]